jgi:hypothetical protein
MIKNRLQVSLTVTCNDKIKTYTGLSVVAYSTTQKHERVTFDFPCTLFVFEDGPARQKDFSLSYACQQMRWKGLAGQNEASTAAGAFRLNNFPL